MSDKLERLGATGKFPDGKINPTDEGELKLAITHTRTHLVIEFGKPVAWLGLGKSEALEFIETIKKHVESM